MQKKQKITKKNRSPRAYSAFIRKIKWIKNKFDTIALISNIYGQYGSIGDSYDFYNTNNRTKEIEVYKLPIWRELGNVQKLAYFCYFMAETKEFTNLKPFTLDFSEEFRKQYKNLSYKDLKAIIIKRMYGNLDYIFKSTPKPMMSFILENKIKNKRKDITDKETHIHGIREVLGEELDSKVRLALKTSVCNGNKEYKDPKYRTMLQTKEGYTKAGAKGWLWYMNKGMASNNGLYISDSLLDKIRNDYNQFYKEYQKSLKQLKKYGIKIKYKKEQQPE